MSDSVRALLEILRHLSIVTGSQSLRANIYTVRDAAERGDDVAFRRDLYNLMYGLGVGAADFAARALPELAVDSDDANAAILGDYGKALSLAAGEIGRLAAPNAESGCTTIESAPVPVEPAPVPHDEPGSVTPTLATRPLRLPEMRVLLARAVDPLIDEILAGMGRHSRHFAFVLLVEEGPHVVYCCSVEATVARALALDVKVPQGRMGGRLLVARGDDAAWLALEELKRFAPAGGTP